METTYKSFYALVLTGIAALCYRLLELAPQLEKDPSYGAFAHIAIAGLLWLLFYHSRNIASVILGAFPLLRRVLARGDYIEGDWPLAVFDCRDGSLVYYGFLSIGYRGGYLAVNGDDWYPDGGYALQFQSMQSRYREGALHYWYMQGEGNQQRGYTFIEFFPREQVSTHMTGVFHDKHHPDVRFYGRKLRYKMFERRKKSKEDRRLAAKAFADEITPRVPQLLRSTVSADWV